MLLLVQMRFSRRTGILRSIWGCNITIGLAIVGYLLAISTSAKENNFWDEEIQVDIDALRAQNYIRCSMDTLLSLREAILRPGFDDVIDKSDGIAGLLRIATKEWKVITAARNFVLPTQPVHVNIMINAKCLRDSGCFEMLFLLPYHEAIQTNGVLATLLPEGIDLDVSLLKRTQEVDNTCLWDVRLDDTSAPNKDYNPAKCGLSCYPEVYTIKLPRSVPDAESIQLRLDYYLGRPFVPLQARLELHGQQRATFSTSSLLQCPYHTAAQRTYFSLLEELNIDIISLHAYASLSEIKSNIFVCGPFEKIELISFGEILTIAIDIHDSLEFIPKMDKIVHVPTVPLTSRITLYEEYIVYNDSSRLEGHFSQAAIKEIETMQNERTGSMNHVAVMQALFPSGATSLRYYDVIGNIIRAYMSDSSPLENYKMVDLVPRYPLLGGWKTSFTVQYCLPQPVHSKVPRGVNTGDNDVYTRMITVLSSCSYYIISLLRGATRWLVDQISGNPQFVVVPMYPSIFYMYIHEASTTVSLPPGSIIREIKLPSYATYQVVPRVKNLLGAKLEVNEVKIKAARLALYNMDAYLADQVEVVYTRSWKWTLQVLLSAFIHAVAIKVAIVVYKRMKSWYDGLGEQEDTNRQ